MCHKETILATLLLAIAATGALTGCGDATHTGTELSVRVDTLGDTIRVHNLAGSDWSDTAKLEPVVIIGTSDGPDEYLLGQVNSLAVGPAGQVYLVDFQVPALRAYDAAGRYIRTFGRKGSGPGEYRSPDGGLAVLTNGDVVLRDPGNGRMIVYNPDGTLVRNWIISSGMYSSRKLYRSNDDDLFSTVLLFRSDGSGTLSALEHLHPDGTVVDTLVIPDLGYESPKVTGRNESSILIKPVPFSANAPWTFAPSKAVVAGIGDAESFTVFRSEHPLIINRDASPVAVQPDESAELRRQITSQMTQELPGWRWNGPDIPATKPAFSALIAAEDGSYWVQVATPGRATMTAEEATARQREGQPPPLRYASPMAYDVFSHDGRYQGRVVSPNGFQSYPEPVIRGDTVWAVTEDPESGTPRVVRYLVVRNDS